MCAIFGIIGKFDDESAKEASKRMLHRGPDESSSIRNGGYLFSVHRLCITDISRHDIQPFEDGGIVVLFNGEIYNYHTLAEELGLRDDATEAQTIHSAFLRWGEDFVDRLEGMFAIALFDGEKIRLYRDAFGKKPLFYADFGDFFIFSSEIKAIVEYLTDDISPRREKLSELLFFQSILPPDTIYREISRLSPGESVIYDSTSGDIDRRYWYEMDIPHPREKETDFQNAVVRIEELLHSAVRKRIPTEVKWGALLSGGLDSSLIASLSSIDRRISTFTIGYDGYDKYDEREWAEITASHIDSDHHEFTMDRESFMESYIELARHLDEPLPDPASVPLWHLMKQISQSGYRAILTGDGSDEIFMGYRLYGEYLDIERASELRHKNWLRNYFRANFSMNKEWERYKRVFDGTLLFRSMSELYTDLQLNRLLSLNVRDDNSLEALSEIRERFLSAGGTEHLDWYSFCDIHTILGELFIKKLDTVSMAHSIEARSPFLDRELVEYIFTLDPSIRLTETNKALLKGVAEKYLPTEIVQRKKRGFSYPFIEWLRESGELETIWRVQRSLGIFREERLEDILSKGRRSNRFKHHIYALASLSRWFVEHGYA